MRKYDLYINGQWTKSSSGRVINVENPATKEIAGQVPRGNADDVDRAVKAARAAQADWAAKPVHERAELMRKLADTIEKKQDELCRVISDEMGVPLKHALSYHVSGASAEARYFADMAETYRYETELEGGMVVREPVGVVAGITPWNYPLDQATYKLFPAIVSGNTVVLKPSQNAPTCCLILAEAFEEAGFPAGVFNVVTGVAGEVGNALATHKDVDVVSFTGSTSGGIEVGKLALETVKKIALELGGKSPMIVLEGGDLEAAVAAVCADVFMNSGQTCCSYTRFLIHESMREKAEQLLKEEAKKYVVGDPLDENTEVGPLVSEKAFNKVKRYIEKGVEEGAKLVVGEVPDSCESGYYVKPTVFMDVKNSMTIAQEEIFGPVLSVISFKDDDEAVKIANDTLYGLASAVFGPYDRALAVAKRIKAGNCSINGAGGSLEFPFGGYKMSGIGRELGVYGFEEFLEIKSVFF